MKFRRVVIECGVLSAALAISSVTTAVSVCAAETSSRRAVVKQTENMAGNGKMMTAVDADLSEWEDQLIVNVSKYSSLNVRAEASTSSEIVGKMYYGNGAVIEEAGDEWTKIKSGDVEGYVKNEYCLFGEDAKELAEEVCATEVTSTANGLRIRSGAGLNNKVCSVLNKGESLEAAEDADPTDNWTAVKYGDTTAYVFSGYVNEELDIETGKTMEQIKAEKAAASAKSTTNSTSGTSSSSTTGTAVSATSDETTLLAAIIMCEAGGECYQGKLAVGAVVLNRVKSSSFPNTISEVIYQSGQFTPASSGKLSRVLSSGNISDDCYSAAQEALNGSDVTGGCLYFHAGTSGKGTVIGNQIFY